MDTDIHEFTDEAFSFGRLVNTHSNSILFSTGSSLDHSQEMGVAIEYVCKNDIWPSL